MDELSKIKRRFQEFLDEFAHRIGSLNHYFNKYIHRSQIIEIIIPSDCNDEDYQVIYELYKLEKVKYGQELNKNSDQELKLVHIKKHHNPSEQIKELHFYKKA